MASERATLTSLLLVLVVFLLGGFGSSDFAQDRAECQDKLVGLATCLPFVGGEDEAKAPTMDCCYGVKEVVEKSKKCVCILIKDRNDPSLGLKINVTLAAHLPSACHAPANLSDCVSKYCDLQVWNDILFQSGLSLQIAVIESLALYHTTYILPQS